MNKVCVREWPVIRGWMWLSALIGFVGGVSMASVGVHAYYNIPDNLDSQQRKMAMACHLPDRDGAMTVFILEDQKLKCWRWK